MLTADRSKRLFLRFLTGSAAMAVAWRLLRRATPFDLTVHDNLAGKLAAVLTSSYGARAIGSAFLRRFPEERNVQVLLDAIGFGNHESGAPPASASSPHWREFLVRRIRDDFASGRVLIIEGWVLSATEVRLCALVALT